MPNTTNYNWDIPADTDLVKDGAAAMRTLGNSIDTTTKNLNPETALGDIAYRSATANTNTRLPIGTTGQVLTVAGGVPTWAAPAGDITAVTAGTGLSGGGTSGDVTLTNTVATAFDAKGDLVVGTGADTFAKLTVGTNGHTLVADSSTATGLKWAAASSGAMTLISRQTFSNVASISFANVFTTTYENYLVYFTNVGATTTTDNFQLQLETSGGAQATNYYGSSIRFAYNSTTLTHEQSSATTAYNIYEDTINTGGQMHITGTGSGASGRLCWTGSVTDTSSGEGAWFYGFRESTTTYTGITFKSGSTNITGTIAIYGLAEA